MWGGSVRARSPSPPANASCRGMTEAKAQAQRVTQSWCTLHWQTISACDRWHFHCVKASETTAARQRAQFRSKSSSFHRKRNSFDIFFFFFVRRGYNTSLEYRFKFFWYCMTVDQNTVSSTCWLTPSRRVLSRMYMDYFFNITHAPRYKHVCRQTAICDLWTYHSKNSNRLSARFENNFGFFHTE